MHIVKRFAIGLAAVLTAALPLVTQAANNQVAIESQVNVGNVTSNANYAKSTNAMVDDVVKVQLWYHNKEEENSGKIASNLRAKIDAPLGVKGKTQTIKTTVSADNSNTTVDQATVNLSLDKASLEFIPGSVKWRHNAGSNSQPNWITEVITDQVVTGPTGAVIENAKPCFNYEATITALFRVRADSVSITKKVRLLGEKDWKVENSAKPGDSLEYLITFKNEGNTVLNKVVVGDNMPAYVTYVKGTTQLKNGANPNGIKITSDNIVTGGIDVGNYNPGAVGYVWFQAKIDKNLKPGNYTLKNVGIVRPEGMNDFYNVAITKINVVTPVGPTPTPTPTPTPGAPAQPAGLPETGLETPLAGLAGTGVIGYSIHAWRKSKKQLIDALLNWKK